MKKKNFFKIASLFILASFLIVTMNNCKKDITEQTTQPAINKTTAVMTAENSLFSKKIIWFDGIMKNYSTDLNYSLNKQFSPDSALWYLEAWFNAKYAFPDSTFVNVVHSNTTLSFTKVGGNITIDELNNKIIILKSNVGTEYKNMGYSKKALISVNLTKITGSSLTEINYDVHIAIGRLGVATRSWNPFGDDDAWKYGDELGKCHESGFAGMDAAEMIEDELNFNKPLVSPPPGYSFSYGPIEGIIRNGDDLRYFNENDPIPEDNDLDRLLFYRTSLYSPGGVITTEEECLEPYAMNFHYNGELEVIYNKIPEEEQKPSNWVFMNCDLKGRYFTDNLGFTAIHHENILEYALRYLVHNGWIVKDESYYFD